MEQIYIAALERMERRAPSRHEITSLAIWVGLRLYRIMDGRPTVH